MRGEVTLTVPALTTWGLTLLVTLVPLGTAEPAGAAPERTTTLASTVAAAASWAGVVPELLAAVIWVESRGHPWALGIGGRTLYPRNHAEAVALLQTASGQADIGLAQVHYPLWGPVFGLRPEDLLDPWTNLHIAARILRYAMDQEPGSWGGVGRYHSATPWRKWQYAGQIAAVARVLREPRVR